jgi:16S rRNA (guanine1207-N2)-methyltransferase
MMRRKRKKTEHYFTAHPKSKPKYGIIRTNLRGRSFEFLTSSGVFSKRRVDLGTRLLVASMILPEEGYVLDVGCGYGAVGVAAAAFSPNLRVFMVDVNTRAVWLAGENIKLNGVRNAEVRRGYLYEPVKELSFNCVLSNPPVSAGMETVEAIIVEAPKHMADKALFQMVVRSKIGGKRLRITLEEAFGNVEILARKSGYRVLVSEKQ